METLLGITTSKNLPVLPAPHALIGNYLNTWDQDFYCLLRHPLMLELFIRYMLGPLSSTTDALRAPESPAMRPFIHLLYQAVATLKCLSAPLPHTSMHDASSIFPVSAALAEEIRALHPLSPTEASSAIITGAHQRLSRFMQGLQRFQATSYLRPPLTAPVIWQEGSTSLYEYSAEGSSNDAEKPVVLFIPSLINRSYILDLREECSLARYLCSNGIHNFLLNWSEPTVEEQHFSSTEYITERITPVIEKIYQRFNRPILVIGYCMGGLLALASCVHHPRAIGGIGLLATPWDFHQTEFAGLLTSPSIYNAVETFLSSAPNVPNHFLQLLFYSINPGIIHDKFSAFADMDLAKEETKTFLAVEHWINDGIPLTAGLAREGLLSWIYANNPLHGKWQVAGKAITPEALTIPAFIAAPQRDKITPPAATQILAERIPNATLIPPDTGHIGMIIGRNARKELWEPLEAWIKSISL